MVKTMSRTEIANRTAKAHRLAAFLANHVGSLADAHLVAALGDDEWERIADLAGERTPSRITRRQIVAMLRRYPTPADAFSGVTP